MHHRSLRRAVLATGVVAASAVLPAVASAQSAPACGVDGVAAASRVSTDAYVNTPGVSRPAWLGGQTLVVERFAPRVGVAGGTLAFIAERTTFAPAGTVVQEGVAAGGVQTYRFTGDFALNGVPTGPVPASGGLPELAPGRTLVVPDIGPLCIISTTPVAGGASIMASRMEVQQAFLAGRFAPLGKVPSPAAPSQPAGTKASTARAHSVGASVRVLERRSGSGSLLGYVDLGTDMGISGAVLDFGWSWDRGSWAKAGFSTRFVSSVTAKVLSEQGLDASDSKSISSVVAAGAFGPVPFTVRLGATGAGRLLAPGPSSMVSTRTKVIPLIVRCQTRRLDSGGFCKRLSGSGADASGVSWSLSYRTGDDVILRGTLTPTLSMLIADFAGPFVGLTSGAEYIVNTSGGRFVSGSGKAFITAKAGGEFRFFGFVKRFSFDIWSKTWPY